jgi:predicted RNase H-like HicB family nuclease
MTRNTSKREFYIIIERDEDGYYIGEVPYLKACYSQGETILRVDGEYERSN